MEMPEDWPIHVKHVGTVDVARVAGLASASQSLADRWQRVRRWVEDDEAYAGVPCSNRTPAAAALSLEDVEALLEHGVIEEARLEDVRGSVRMFTVPEPKKQRRRAIKHTKGCNDALGAATLEGVRFPSKSDIVGMVHKGSHFISLDFAAYYDQFKYAEEIRDRFCFTDELGHCWRLRTLAMGQRQAVDVAHAATERMLDFEKTCSQYAVIDNVALVGRKDEVERDATTFIDRAISVGATFNEDISAPRALVTTKGEWCGIELDFDLKTVRLAAKTVHKTRATWEKRHTWTYRQFAAHIGLLFWSLGILDIPMQRFYPLLQFVREVGKLLTQQPLLWDTAINVWPSAHDSLAEWTQLVFANAARAVPKDQPPSLFVATDASRWGWGFVAHDALTGAVSIHGERWNFAFRRAHYAKLAHSSFAEPWAIINAMCRLLKPHEGRTVLIGTDSMTAKAAFSRGYGKSFDTNRCVEQLKARFPKHTFRLMHIAGVSNPADGPSRGVHAQVGETEATRAGLHRVLGVEL